jgi:hypothetical protein
MDQASSALCFMAAMETKIYKGKRDDEAWDIGIPCLEIALKWLRPMVEFRCFPYEQGFPREVL